MTEFEMSRYHHLVEKNPDDPAIFNSRGLAYYSLQQYEEALIDFDKAIKLKPDYVEALNNRSLIYFYQKHFELALRDLETALQIDPQNAESYNNRGLVHEAMDKKDLAQTDFAKATELSFMGEGFANLGLATSKQGDADSLLHGEFAANLLTKRTF